MMYRYQCSGVKHCQYLDISMRNVSHTYVSEEELENLRVLRDRHPDATDPDPLRRNAAKYVSYTFRRCFLYLLLKGLTGQSVTGSRSDLLVGQARITATPYLDDSEAHHIRMVCVITSSNVRTFNHSERTTSFNNGRLVHRLIGII